MSISWPTTVRSRHVLLHTHTEAREGDTRKADKTGGTTGRQTRKRSTGDGASQRALLHMDMKSACSLVARHASGFSPAHDGKSRSKQCTAGGISPLRGNLREHSMHAHYQCTTATMLSEVSRVFPTQETRTETPDTSHIH